MAERVTRRVHKTALNDEIRKIERENTYRWVSLHSREHNQVDIVLELVEPRVETR